MPKHPPPAVPRLRPRRPPRCRWPWAGGLGLGLALLASGCAAGPESPAASLDAMKRLIGHAACTENAQCTTVAVGARACGGPDAYLAWSRTATDAAALDKLARQHAQERQAQNSRLGVMSTCDLLEDPGARCVKTGPATGRCTLNPTPGGAPAAAR